MWHLTIWQSAYVFLSDHHNSRRLSTRKFEDVSSLSSVPRARSIWLGPFVPLLAESLRLTRLAWFYNPLSFTAQRVRHLSYSHSQAPKRDFVFLPFCSWKTYVAIKQGNRRRASMLVAIRIFPKRHGCDLRPQPHRAPAVGIWLQA